MSWNFPGFPGLGIIFNGEDWTGPKKDSSMSRVNGPTYVMLLHKLLLQDLIESIVICIDGRVVGWGEGAGDSGHVCVEAMY